MLTIGRGRESEGEAEGDFFFNVKDTFIRQLELPANQAVSPHRA